MSIAAIYPSTAWQAGISRRNALASVATTAASLQPALAADETLAFENRDRKSNKGAVIREDYWYMMGSTPPRLLEGPLKGDDPKWNAFGSCSSSESGGNSCTYVSLNQRIPAYSKYGFSISYGGKEYEKLGQVLSDLTKRPDSSDLWNTAASYIVTEPGSVPPAIVDAELKAILLATALMTSPNFPIPSKQLLVARFYVNEAHYAAQQMQAAIADRNLKRAVEAYKFGKDSWNSYYQVVNTSISPKVGDKFTAIV